MEFNIFILCVICIIASMCDVINLLFALWFTVKQPISTKQVINSQNNMRLNSNTKLIGQKTILVPYDVKHVPKYHNWMKSEELQKLTASVPLSLEDEYEMQESWRNDDDKCTFIILNKSLCENDDTDSMVGDTNIFIIDKESAIGEIEIMIAEASARGQKLGWEAVILMLIYGIKFINLRSYIAKISLSNDTSINMFKKLGFTEHSTSAIFQEVTLEKSVSEEWVDWLQQQISWKIEVF